MIYLYLFGTCFHFIYVFMIIGNIANFAPTNAEAIHIWKLTKKYNRRELNVLRWLLPRLQTQ